MCFIKDKAKPQIELLKLSGQKVRQEIDNLEIKLLYPTLMDASGTYYYTKAEDWAEIFNYIYFKFKMPKYVQARFDCEDFAMWMKGLVSALFGLNYFGLVFGESPFGYHSWNLFKADNGVWQFEPQKGDFFLMKQRGYVPEYILL